MSLAIQTIDSRVLRDTLLAIENPVGSGQYPFRIAFPLEGFSGQYKIFWEHVPASIALPYVTLTHIMGGRGRGQDSSFSTSDTTWKVVVHTMDMSEADNYADMVSLLTNRCPVVTSFVGVTPVTAIEESMPVFDRYLVQSNPAFMIGGLYRLQLNLGSN